MSPIAAADFELAVEYWLGEFPSMADRLRSSILTGVLGLLHVFNTGMVRELVSTTTNVSPQDMLERRSRVMVNIPPAKFGDAGVFINAGWKYLTQQRVLARDARPGDPIHVCWCDEAQQLTDSMDAHSSRCADRTLVALSSAPNRCTRITVHSKAPAAVIRPMPCWPTSRIAFSMRLGMCRRQSGPAR